MFQQNVWYIKNNIVFTKEKKDNKKIYLLIFTLIEKSAPHLKKKWSFAKVTIYLNLGKTDELQKTFLGEI